MRSQAQTLYVPGCNNGATICSGSALNAKDPRNGQILTCRAANSSGGDRHADPRLRQPAERHPPGGRRHRQDRLHLAGDRRWSALWRGLRHQRQPDDRAPRRRRHLLRPSGRQHRLLDPGQPAHRQLRGPSLRPVADPHPGPQHPAEPAARDVPVRGEGARTVAVAGGRAARAAVGHGHRSVVCRQPRLQPDGRASGRQRRST